VFSKETNTARTNSLRYCNDLPTFGAHRYAACAGPQRAHVQ